MNTALPHCALPRRLAAILYDTLLLLGVVVIAFLPYTLLRGGEASGRFDPLALLYLLAVSFAFFGWFWTHGGQTLGMRVWRLRVQTRDGHAMTWPQALLRFLTAFISWGAVGFGFLWSLFDREGLTWHDRWSETVVVVLPKRTA